MRQELITLVINRDKAKIEDILSKNTGKNIEELEQALIAGGISPGVIPRLKEKGNILGGPANKKKSFF